MSDYPDNAIAKLLELISEYPAKEPQLVNAFNQAIQTVAEANKPQAELSPKKLANQAIVSAGSNLAKQMKLDGKTHRTNWAAYRFGVACAWHQLPTEQERDFARARYEHEYKLFKQSPRQEQKATLAYVEFELDGCLEVYARLKAENWLDIASFAECEKALESIEDVPIGAVYLWKWLLGENAKQIAEQVLNKIGIAISDKIAEELGKME